MKGIVHTNRQRIVTLGLEYENPMSEAGWRALIEALTPVIAPKLKHRRLCVFDYDGHGNALFGPIKELFSSCETVYANDLYPVRRGNGGEQVVYDYDYDFAIAACAPGRYYRAVRESHYHFVNQPPVILPFAPARNRAAESEMPLGEPRPIFVVLYPGAGTARLMPPLNALMERYDRIPYSHIPFGEAFFNLRYIDAHIDPDRTRTWPQLGVKTIDQKSVDDYYVAATGMMNYFSWMGCHCHVSTDMLGNLPGVRVVYLLRDPRDIFNSMFHRIIHDGSIEGFRELRALDPEEALLQFVSGFEFVTPHRDNFFHLPPIGEVAAEFAKIADYENIYPLKFEDVRYRARDTYRGLIEWLGYDDISIIPMGDAEIDAIAHLGTFEAQTGGARRDGDDKGGEAVDRSSKFQIDSNVRKGIHGDWKRLYTPRIADYVKREAGDALIALGYEQDLDW